MNALDESLAGRVRSAMHATAGEIGPDEVPPLGSRARLLTSTTPGGAGGLGGTWRAGGRRARWGAPLAAAVAVLAVVAASQVAGTAPDRTTAPGSTTAPGGAPPYGSVARLTSGLVSLYLTASGAQFTAGQQFTATYGPMENAIVLRCLAGRGFHLPAGTVVAGQGGDWDLAQFPDLASIARAGALPGGDARTPARPPGAIPASVAYLRALDLCMDTAHDPFTAVDDYGVGLGASFLALVTAIQSSAPVQATIPALRACAAKYGWPRDSQGASRPLKSFGDFVTWVLTFLGKPSSEQELSSPTETALRRQWGPRFVECARPAVAVMERLQLAAQRTYLIAHGAQLARLVDLAERAFSVAAAPAAK